MKIHIAEVNYVSETAETGFVGATLKISVHPIVELDASSGFAKVARTGIQSISTFGSIIMDHTDLCDALERMAESIRFQLDNVTVEGFLKNIESDNEPEKDLH